MPPLLLMSYIGCYMSGEVCNYLHQSIQLLGEVLMYRHWDLLVNSLVHCGSQSFTACPLSPFRNGVKADTPFTFLTFALVGAII